MTPVQHIREMARKYVSFIVDDALNGRRVDADPDAYVREEGDLHKYASTIIGWTYQGQDTLVAVHSYLDVRLTDKECIDLSKDYLDEVLGRKPRCVAFIIR